MIALCVLIAATLLTPPGDGSLPPTDPAELTDLTLLADAGADKSWAAEAFASRAATQLGALAEILKAGDVDPDKLSRIAATNARSDTLYPSDTKTVTVGGGIRVDRWSLANSAAPRDSVAVLQDSLAVAIERLQTSLGGAPTAARIKFKILAVQPVASHTQPSVRRRWSTTVRYEAFAERDGRRRQQVATWNVSWSTPSDHESALPLIDGIRIVDFEATSTSIALFTDVTRGALRSDNSSEYQLARGAEYWHGKIDALGEWNFMGHNGIAIGDVNGDGLDDVYVAMGTGLPNQLLIQQADGTVRDTAMEANVAWLDDTKGVILADMDNDGDADLLCAIGPSIVLCHNDGTGSFGKFVSMRAPTAASFYSLSVADYDLDGDLDIYGCRYVKLRYGVSIPMPFHDANNGPSNHLLRNDGGGVFVDVTSEVGLSAGNTRFSLAATWADYDDDGDVDLYVANDFGRNNLYRNDGGTFVDVAAVAGVEDQAAGMGASWSDFDLDGDLDLYVSNMFSSAGRRIAYQPAFMKGADASARSGAQRHSLGNSLFANNGAGGFSDVSDEAGVRMGRWAWGAKFVDVNNDGWDDIVVPNGFLTNTLPDDL